MTDVTRILSAIEQGDPDAAAQLLPLVYDELRKLAARRLANEAPGQTLQATALVHEAYLRLVDSDGARRWDSRGHFFAAAAEAMRRILVENYRRKHRAKRGGDQNRVHDEEAIQAVASPVYDLVALDDALEALGKVDSTAAGIVKLKYFAGLSIPEIADVLGIAPRTVDRHWAYARAWLHQELGATEFRVLKCEWRDPAGDGALSSGGIDRNGFGEWRVMRERAIFMAALDFESASSQGDFIERECGGDETLKARVEALLHSHRAAGSFLHDQPLVGQARDPVEVTPEAEGPGTLIGSYKLLERIGEGGFGVVYMAEQLKPVRRKVALKIVKPGMDTRQVIARFEAERQALAIMDHANIAKVLDGGVSPSGRPYFVMDLIKGVPITEFCDQNQLSARRRLELFITVCHAVQHAHQKGIIHRDLKPSNVLITQHDTTPVVKIIDFGVAKALGQELTEKTLFTGFAQMLGTPLYMSPEQAGQSGLDVDTRSDIYSLGVLLYELLTGTTPFDGERFKTAAFDEIRRIIREEEPLKPSSRVSAARETLKSISAQRQTEPAKLTKLLKGDIDWIVMKALEKDRTRRYVTANAFAEDLEHCLAGEPVKARPPSTSYRVRKFVRRNQGWLFAAGVLGLACLLVVGSFGWILRDRESRRSAVNRELELATEEAGEARAGRSWR